MNSLFRLALLAIICGLVWPHGIVADCASEAPKLITPVNPEYPPLALKRKIQGNVTLELAVNVEGKVLDARVVGDAQLLLDEVALSAARQWRYSPSPKSEINHVFDIWVKVSFSLHEKSIQILALTEAPSIAFVSDDLPLKLVKKVEIVLPLEMRQQQVEATMAFASLQINHSGEVTCVQILRSGNPMLNEPAISALKQWRYQMPIKKKSSWFPIYKNVMIRLEVR